MFGECDDENMMLSLITMTEESNSNVHHEREYQSPLPVDVSKSERCDTKQAFFSMLGYI